MKKILYILTGAAMVACGRPRTIPNEDLTAIFREAFLVNAYHDTHGGYRMDSADIYGPIIARHGYSVRDFDYTVTNFARKKSSKLSDVVGKAIDELTAESAVLDARVGMRDTIDAIAARATSQRVWWADSIIVRKASDTARLRIKVPALEGEYVAEYRYLIDTADKNMSLNTSLDLLDSAGVRRNTRMDYLGRRGESLRSNGLRIEPDTLSRWVELRLAGYPENMKTPHARFDSVAITHYLPRRAALDSVSGRWLKISRYDYTQNRGASRPLPPWRDSLAAY